MRIWRICRAPFAAEAFGGEGARRFGGRWNSRGVPMVYASTSLALGRDRTLCAFGTRPGAGRSGLPFRASAARRTGAQRRIRASYRQHWWADSALDGTRALGDAWIAARTSLAILVPSVPIRAEWNVLVNPLHPGLSELQIDPPQPFAFDARMFQAAPR